MQPSDIDQARSSGSRENLNKPDIDNVVEVMNDDLEQKLEADAVNNLWDYEEVLSILGFGKTQWILLFVSGLLTMTSLSAFYSMGIIGISSQCEFGVSQGEKGVMMAASVTGIVLSTYIWGCMCDIWGRHIVLKWSIFSTNLLQLILMFITNIWVYNVINFIMGISLGGILGAIYPYLSEFNTAKYRSVVINYCNLFVSITVMYVPAISWLVLSYDWSLKISDSFVFKPWRLIILLSILPGFIGGLILLRFPESPKLLLANNRQMEALKALNWISKFNTGQNLETVLKTKKIALKPEELADVKLLKMGTGCSILSNIWKATAPVFHKPHGLNVVKGIIAIMGMMFCTSGMQVWFPEIVNRLADGSQWLSSSTLCEILNESYIRDRINSTTGETLTNVTCDDSIDTKTYIDNITMGLAFLIGFSVQGLFLQPLGRKNVLMFSLSVGTLSGILINFVTNTMGILILLCLFALMPGLATSVMCGVMVDLVPTRLRGKAVSLGFTLGRLGTILATNLIAVMLEPYCSGIFGIITCVFFVCTVLVYCLPF